MCYFGLEFTESRPLGATWALDALWSRLGIGAALHRLLADHLDDSAERVLFALVAQRALVPVPKLAAARWISEDVTISGLPATTDDACYRAMGWLTEIKDALQREVFERATLLQSQQVDLLLFNTTATYSETELSQVLGMAVAQDGIPVRTWCWPGNIINTELTRQVREDMWGWVPARMIWVSDRRALPVSNQRHLREGGNEYIIGEKLGSGSAEANAVLSRPGRYQGITPNLRVKEVRIGGGERFIICHDAVAAERDAAIRNRLLDRLEKLIKDTDTLTGAVRAEKLRGFVIARHGRHRYLRVTGDGRLRIDAKAVSAEENLDGKYLLCASDPTMATEEIALRYQQLLDVERRWRHMRQAMDPRNTYHRTEEGIGAHVLLCWLALLLARVAENACHDSWPKLRQELDRMAIGTFSGPAGILRQRTEITGAQLSILAKLAIDPPPRICQFTPAASC
jgi:hypothetical protein